MSQTCKKCQQVFEVRSEDLSFYEKFSFQSPAFCPACRLQQRLNFRNERTLYKRTSTLSNKSIISIYHQEQAFPVYSPDEWWSDNWNGLDYGQEFDFSRPFFEQFSELLRKVPRIALFNVNPENSDYCQQAYGNRNCYLCTVVKDCQDSEYLTHTNRAKDSLDSSHTQNIELCYECLDSDKLYECIECQGCQNCNNLLFCHDCIGSKDCLGSSGLRNKQYYIVNKPYSKEEYQQKFAFLELHKYSNYQKYKQHFQNLARNRIHRSDNNINTVDCVGNYLIHAKNCYHCFDAFEIEDSAYSTWIFESHHCHDIYGMGTSEFVYNAVGVEDLHNSAHCTFVSNSSDIFYSDLCFYSQNLFGCIGLKKQKNCILNRQYTPEEYEILKGEIMEHMQKTGEWGQFFPVELSPFTYNESVAIEYFPLSKEQVLQQGFRWRDEDKKENKPQTMSIPESVHDIPAEILNELLACTQCGKNYKINSEELKFYQKMNLPLPRKCFLCRYLDRFQLRNPGKLFSRECQKCHIPLQTTYAPNRPEVIYCEKCYLETVL